MTSQGQGVDSDPSEAAQLFTELAMQGHPYAQVEGTMTVFVL